MARFVCALFAGLLMVAGLALPVMAAEEIPLWPIEKQMLEHTNAQRQYYGLPALQLDKDLLNSARRHCFWMASARAMQHTSDPVAENIAMGQRTTAEAVNAWMNSPGHRANMLGSYRRLGVAAYETYDGKIYWCVQFMW